MKLELSCPECQKSTITGGVQDSVVEVELRDDGFYEIICNNHHKSRISIQNPKFEILFEMAVFALLDGYFREAVTGFAITIERLHEFCILILCEANKVPEAEATAAWKSISKQSERQFGAFVFSLLFSTKCNISNINEAQMKSKKVALSSFRNKVVHEGYIPSHDEALEFGDIVLRYGRDLLKQLRGSFGESFPRVFLRTTMNKGHHANSSMMLGTILNSALSVQSTTSDSLEEVMAKLRQQLHIGAHAIKKN